MTVHKTHKRSHAAHISSGARTCRLILDAGLQGLEYLERRLRETSASQTGYSYTVHDVWQSLCQREDCQSKTPRLTQGSLAKIRVKRVRPLRPAVDRRVGKPKPPRARRPRWRAKFITSGFGASGSTQNVCRAVVPRMVPRLPQPVQWRSMRAAIASAPRGPQSSRRAARDSPELGGGGRHGIRTPGVRRAAPRALQRAPGGPASTAGWWSAAAARAPRGL